MGSGGASVMRDDVEEPQQVQNAHLDREVTGCRSLLLYCGVFIVLDFLKQLSVYGTLYFNQKQFPLRQSLIVAYAETLKLTIFVAVLLVKGRLSGIQWSFWYGVPSGIYALNNNLYYFALHFVSPPVWNVLIQTRVFFTALTYRWRFQRTLQRSQWLAMLLLVMALVLTQIDSLSSGEKSQGRRVFVTAALLAVISSALSVASSITTEYLFKNDKGSFAEAQLQFYFFGSIQAWFMVMAHCMYIGSIGDLFHPIILNRKSLVVVLLITGIVLQMLFGISVAFLVKKLDNIVKLYTAALSNIMIAGASTFLFPKEFKLTWVYALSLSLCIGAILLYELQPERLSPVIVTVSVIAVVAAGVEFDFKLPVTITGLTLNATKYFAIKKP